MIRDYLGGLSQLRAPFRLRIVLLLLAAGADGGWTQVPQANLADLLGVRWHKNMRKALDDLEKARMIERIPAAGSRAATIRLSAPDRWLEPGWAVASRQEALRRVVSLKGIRAGNKRRSALADRCALGPVARSARDAETLGLRAGGAPRANPSGARSAAPARKPATRGGPSQLPEVPSELPSFLAGENEGTKVASLSKEGRQLIAAFERGLGRSTFGDFPGRLAALAESANGSLGRLVELAERPDVRSPLAKLEGLERALLDGSPPAPFKCSGCGRLNDRRRCWRDDCVLEEA